MGAQAQTKINANLINKDATLTGNNLGQLGCDTANVIATRPWVIANFSGGGSGVAWGAITGNLPDQLDLQAALDLKLNFADTTSMLFPYLLKQDAQALYYPLTGNPSNFLTSADLSGFVMADGSIDFVGMETFHAGINVENAVNTDTLFVSTDATITGNLIANNFSGNSSNTNTGDQDLTPYLLKSDTAGMLSPYALDETVNLKLNISDTSAMLLNYKNALNTKQNYSDTTTYDATYYRLYKAIDSLALTVSGGTVTNIATGWGTTGGPITTTGTIKADSSAVTSIYQNSLKLNKTDTAFFQHYNDTLTWDATSYDLHKSIDSLSLLIPTGLGTMSKADSVTFHGNTNIKILGTITNGIWNGTAIDTQYVNSVSRITAGLYNTVAVGGKTYTINNDTSSSGFSGKYVRLKDSLTIYATPNYVNTRGFGMGSVTSVSAGYGTNFTAITNSGSVIVDTSIIVNKTGIQLLTNKAISGASNTLSNIGNSSLSNSAISGVSLGGTLFSHSVGYGISGSAYNGSAIQTWVADTNCATCPASKTRLSNSIAGFGSGTVTNIATGYGLSGGPISTAGTLLVDSATLSAKYKRQTDSTNVITGYTPLYQNSLKSPSASPTFTGIPIAPTATAGTNTTQIATTAYADNLKRITIPFSSISLTTPADATSYYYGCIPALSPTTTSGARAFVVPVACTIKSASLSIIFTGTNPTSENVSFYVRKANTTDFTLTTTVNMSVGANVPIYVVITGLSIPLNGTASDFIEVKMITPTWATNPTNLFVSGVLYATE